jgi:hypothetical protein
VDEGGASSPKRRGRPKKTDATPAKAKGKLSPEGRARIIAALKKRWAAKKKAAKKQSEATQPAVGTTPPD